uniref:Ubiquitin carboxyl-terminal hydrolase 5 n=1 Tax=Strombidium inclinatum TaxID=197538 RepID=A0A7S3INU9_9SPIT|mmetsp:Transcript_31142/g.47613  ORF Transcript_31142/g.47613 Transcript_31142/m.47613 type:complete len:190 (+) Transcript_31142:1834-2403(+)
MVIQMGIPENPAKHALYKTGNNSADMAVTWYFENMADESLNLPLRIKKAGGSGPGSQEVDPEKLMLLTSMGLPEKKCKKALLACDQNVERASDWVFSHMDDPDSDGDSVMANQEESKEASEYVCNKPGVYKLQSFITHLGASVHAGHYVCHVKKEVEGQPTWVYFNDAKVAATTEPPIGKGYLYFLEKK